MTIGFYHQWAMPGLVPGNCESCGHPLKHNEWVKHVGNSHVSYPKIMCYGCAKLRPNLWRRFVATRVEQKLTQEAT